MKFVTKIITYFEEHSAPMSNFIAVFLFTVLCRNFFEMYATGQDDHLLQVLTYSPFYIGLASWLILLMQLLTGESVIKVSRVVLPFFLLILLPPVADLLLGGGTQVRMRYIAVTNVTDMIRKFFTWLDPCISVGQRIEIALVIICSFFYFKTKCRSWIKSIFSAILIYASIFLFGIFMFLLNTAFQWLQLNYVADNIFLLPRFYFIITLFCLSIIYYRHNKKVFIALLKDIRPLRMLHFILMLLLGFILYLKDASLQEKYPLILNNANIFLFPLVIISGIFAGIYSIITNNIEDIEADKISNPDRPLVRHAIAPDSYKRIAWVSLLISLLAACLAGKSCFIFMSLTIGAYYIYSNPPFKLKRIPFLAKFMIGLGSFFMALLGFNLFGAAVLAFPLNWLFYILLPLPLAGNFIDLKDYKGDKATGIITLPVLLGMRNARLLIAFFTLCCYITLYFILKKSVEYVWLPVPFALFACAQLFFLFKKDYKELPIFLIYLSGMGCMLALLYYA